MTISLKEWWLCLPLEVRLWGQWLCYRDNVMFARNHFIPPWPHRRTTFPNCNMSRMVLKQPMAKPMQAKVMHTTSNQCLKYNPWSAFFSLLPITQLEVEVSKKLLNRRMLGLWVATWRKPTTLNISTRFLGVRNKPLIVLRHCDLGACDSLSYLTDTRACSTLWFLLSYCNFHLSTPSSLTSPVLASLFSIEPGSLGQPLNDIIVMP